MNTKFQQKLQESDPTEVQSPPSGLNLSSTSSLDYFQSVQKFIDQQFQKTAEHDVQIQKELKKDKQNENQLEQLQRQDLKLKQIKNNQKHYSSLSYLEEYYNLLCGQSISLSQWLTHTDSSTKFSSLQKIQKSQSQNDKLKPNLNSYNQNKNQQQSETLENQRIDQISQKIYQQSKQLIQQSHKKLTSHNKFFRVQNPVSQFTILNIQPSKYYEVVKLQVQLQHWITQITILNQVKPSMLHKQIRIKDSGTFGNIYLSTVQEKEYSIKCIQFPSQLTIKQQKDILYSFQIIKQHLKQYFFVKFFSALQIGPHLKNVYGFDILLTPYCIEFSMQICICKQLNDLHSQSLLQSLKQMHLLNICHRDIKPQNIMYSPSLKKFVFIDFGSTQFVNQKIGYKSLSTFYGTAMFCTPQVIELLERKQSHVDLYYNDLYGLKKSILSLNINVNLKKISQQLFPQQVVYSKISSQYQIKFLVLQLLYKLYNKQYDQANQLYQVIINKYLITQSIQKQIYYSLINFIVQLDPSKQIQQIYHKILYYKSDQCEDSTKSINKQLRNNHKTIHLVYNNFKRKQITQKPQSWVYYDFKQQIMQKTIVFYQTIQLQISNIISIFHNCDLNKHKQKRVEMILLSKQRIQSFIFQNKSSQQDRKIIFTQNNDNLKYYCFIVMHYCSFGQNFYNADITLKLKAVKMAYQKLSQYNIIDLLAYKCVYTSPLVQVDTICTFIQYFIFEVWKQLPLNYKQKSFKSMIFSLLLLGYPIQSNYYKKLLGLCLITCESNKLYKLAFYWQFQLYLYNFHMILYNNNSQHYYKKTMGKNYQDLSQKYDETINELMNQWDQNSSYQEIKFYKLNRLFYQYLIKQVDLMTNAMHQELKQILLTKSNKQFHLDEDYYKKWQSILKLIINKIQSRKSQQKPFPEENIDSFNRKKQKDKKIMPLIKIKNQDIQHDSLVYLAHQSYIQTVENIINYEPLSTRFLSLEMMFYYLKKNNVKSLNKLIQLYLDQCKYYSQKNIIMICSSLKMILINHNLIVNKGLFQNLSQQYIERYYFKPLIKKSFELIEQYLLNYYFKKNIKNPQSMGQIKQIENRIEQIKQEQIQNQIQKINDKDKRQKHFIFYILGQLNILKRICNFQIKISRAEQQIKKKSIKNKQEMMVSQSVKKITNNNTQGEQDKINTDINDSEQKIREYIESYKDIKEILIKSNQYYSRTKQMSRFKQLIQESIYTKKKYFNLLRSEDNIQPKVLIDNYHKLFQSFSIYNLHSIQLDQPSIFAYLQKKIKYSNYSLVQYQNWVNFYYYCLQRKSIYPFNQYLKKLYIKNIYIFQGLIYLRRPWSQIHQFFLDITSQLKYYYQEKYLNIFNSVFNKKFSCLCNECYRKKIEPQFQLRMIEQFIKNIDYTKVKQQYCMSLIYYYCLCNKFINLKYKNKLLHYIYRSLQYLSPKCKRIIQQKIYLIRIRMILESNEYDKKSKSKKLINKLQQTLIKTKNKVKNNRKIIYLQNKQIKYQDKEVNLEEHINKRLESIKRSMDTSLPQNIEQLIKKKLQKYQRTSNRYHMKGEYKVSQIFIKHIRSQLNQI